MRVQFEIDDELIERLIRYHPNLKTRGECAKDAFVEWITRQEGRDKRFRAERLLSDKAILKPLIRQMIDAGELSVK